MGPDSQSMDPCLAGLLDRGTLVCYLHWSAIYWVNLRLDSIESTYYVYGWIKLWVSEQRLFDKANVRDRKTGRNLVENDSYKEEERRSDDTGSNLGEEVRYFDSIGSRWGDWQFWGRRGCHNWRNRGVRKKTDWCYQLLEIYQRRSYYRKLLKLIKFCVRSSVIKENTARVVVACQNNILLLSHAILNCTS